SPKSGVKIRKRLFEFEVNFPVQFCVCGPLRQIPTQLGNLFCGRLQHFARICTPVHAPWISCKTADSIPHLTELSFPLYISVFLENHIVVPVLKSFKSLVDT
uniref:Uncharacterized protein n=1 Tax=Ciona savignyi TaxID=51511 RepID=H2Y4U5_CIOSA